MTDELVQGNVILVTNGTLTVWTNLALVTSSVGVFLSFSALVLLFTTAILFKKWRSSFKNQLLMQFMTARFLYITCRYHSDVMKIFSLSEPDHCIIHLDNSWIVYTELLLVAWMFTFSKHMYDSLVIVFTANTTRIWKVSLLVWTVPALVTMLIYFLFALQYEQDLKVFFVYLSIVKWPVLIANAVILIMVLTSLIKPNESRINNRNNTRLILVMSALIFFFCFQQVFVDIFKLLYVLLNLTTFALTVLNVLGMYQCAFAILFWVFGNSDTRQLWKDKCCKPNEKRMDEIYHISHA